MILGKAMGVSSILGLQPHLASDLTGRRSSNLAKGLGPGPPLRAALFDGVLRLSLTDRYFRLPHASSS